MKSVTYEKAISEEVAQLIMKAIDYTKERYGETTYIFTKKDDPTRPYQYSMIQNQIMTMIRQEDIRDDNGEFLKFGTHIFRHCYGKKLTEMHVDDWMIAKLLGHTSIYSVHHYRKIGNKLMADETRAAREKMDMILLDIIEGWVIMKYDKMVAITQAESQRKMNIAKNTISDMLKNMERITVAELVKRTGLSRGFFL